MARAWVVDLWVKDALVTDASGETHKISPSAQQLKAISTIPKSSAHQNTVAENAGASPGTKLPTERKSNEHSSTTQRKMRSNSELNLKMTFVEDVISLQPINNANLKTRPLFGSNQSARSKTRPGDDTSVSLITTFCHAGQAHR